MAHPEMRGGLHFEREACYIPSEVKRESLMWRGLAWAIVSHTHHTFHKTKRDRTKDRLQGMTDYCMKERKRTRKETRIAVDMTLKSNSEVVGGGCTFQNIQDREGQDKGRLLLQGEKENGQAKNKHCSRNGYEEPLRR